MIFHHHIKIFDISLIGIVVISQAITMDLVVNDVITEETGSIRVDTPIHEKSSEIIKPDVTNSIITANPIVPISPKNIPQSQEDEINPSEDVPGCADNYFRCCILHWRIAKGWYSFGSLLTGSFGAGILIPAILDIAPEYRKALEISAVVLTSTATLLQAIKVFGIQQIQEHQAVLREIIVESQVGDEKMYKIKTFRKRID